MAWSFIASESAGGTDSLVTTAAMDTTGATLLVASISRDVNTNPINFTDSKSNTWNLITYVEVGALREMLFYSKPTSVGSGHTFSNSGAFNFSSITVAAFSGNRVNNVLDISSAGSSSATTVQPGSITPSHDNALVVCSSGFTGTGSTPISINGSFTEVEELDFSSGNYYGSGLAYLIQTTSAAANPTWTKTGATPHASIIASFTLSPEVNTAWIKG